MKVCMGGKLVLMNSMLFGFMVFVVFKIWVSVFCVMFKVFCVFLCLILVLFSDVFVCRCLI